MHFIPCRHKDLKAGDYVKYVNMKMPSSELYGYIRIWGGEKHYQCKNIIQRMPDGKFFHIKPSRTRFYKGTISTASKLWKLV